MIINTLPPGWTEAELSDLVTEIYNIDPSDTPTKQFTYFDISSIDNASGRVVAPKILFGRDAPSRARQAVRPGDILFSTVRPNLRAIAKVPQVANPVASTGFCVLRAASGVDSNYLYFLLRSDEFLQNIVPLQRGVSYPAVRAADVRNQRVPLAPSTEQTHIVKALEQLFSGLDVGAQELITAQTKLKRYQQSVIKAAVDGTQTASWREVRRQQESEAKETGAQLLERILTERRAHWEAKQLANFKEMGKDAPNGWKSRYPTPVLPDTTALPALPDEWVWASLDMLGEIVSGVAKGTKRNEGIALREVPYLRVANVQRGYLDLVEVKTILATEREINELSLRDGDVLFNEGGDRDKLGRGWVWRDEVPNCIHQNHIFRMRLYLPEMLPELVSYHGNTFGQTWFESAGKQTTNLASINLKSLRAFPVPVAPAAEQKEILSQLKLQTAALALQDDAILHELERTEAQRKNILRAAFCGQLVPQDAKSEPASVLLKRLQARRAEREKQPKARNTRTTKEIIKMARFLRDVLSEAGDWLSAQEAFSRCGVADGAVTEQIEILYAELKSLDKRKRLAVEPVTDAQGRKLYDRLKLVGSD